MKIRIGRVGIGVKRHRRKIFTEKSYKVKVWRRWLLCCFCFIWICQMANLSVCKAAESMLPPLENLQLYATSAVLMDADSGRILYEKNGNSVMAMASTTKIMTCIITLEYANLEEEVGISAYAASMPKVKLYVKPGETYFLKDLLYSLMLESHNDAAAAIAEHIGKKYLAEELQQKETSSFSQEESKQAIAAFAKLMNQKAKEIGCMDTWFITPNGLDATETIHLESGESITKEHSTTAADLARIMSYCIDKSPKKEDFLHITRTASYSFFANERDYSCNNHNAFLNMMEGALSGKTGFTNKAGYCYVGAVERDGKMLVVALLACGWPNNKTYKWSDTRELMEYGLKHYAYHEFTEVPYDTTMLQPIPVLEGCTKVLGTTAYTKIGALALETQNSQSIRQGLLLREDENFEIRYSLQKELTAPVEEGTVVGQIEYLVNDIVYQTIPVVTLDKVTQIDFKWCLQQIGERFLKIEQFPYEILRDEKP